VVLRGRNSGAASMLLMVGIDRSLVASARAIKIA